MSVAFPPLYAIIDAALLRTSELAFAEMLAESGVELIQFRDKVSSPRAYFQKCRLLAGMWSGRGRFVVNDRPDIASLVRAGGVHVGQGDLDVEDARRICGHGGWVGVSTHTLDQVQRAAATSADYVAVGPVFPTSSKVNSEPVVGTALVAQARVLTAKPLIAIGGITAESAEAVYRAGADSVAVAGDLLRQPRPGPRVREYFEVAARIGK